VAARSTGAGAMAQGQGAVASYAGSVALGAGAQATADPTTAVGSNAVASASNAVALGANAVANASNSVALGQGSVADRANSVSIGSSQQLRQLTNLAPGTMGTDAVNLDQLTGAIGGLQKRLKTDIDRMGATALAASQIAMPAAPGKTTIGLGVGSSGGQEAVAFGIAHMPQFAPGITFRATVSATSSMVAGGAGISLQF
jgi:autotransporter adhesin